MFRRVELINVGVFVLACISRIVAPGTETPYDYATFVVFWLSFGLMVALLAYRWRTRRR